MRPAAYTIVTLEILALGSFLALVATARSFSQLRGGGGDSALISLWNSRAALAFWSLAALWLVALTLCLIQAMRIESTATKFPLTLAAFGVALPAVGLVLGYIAVIVRT